MSALDEIRAERLKKVELLLERGIDPYPPDSRQSHTVAQFVSGFADFEATGKDVTLAGRIMSLRHHGGSSFLDLFDGTGKVQGFVSKTEVGEDAFSLYLSTVDESDFVELTGRAFTTKRGEKSLAVRSWRMLAKSLHPVPDQWFGIKDEEERYRKRYLDILLSPEVADIVRKRSVFWNTMREFLLERQFVEVETPILENTTGGAEARPFVTHHNALDIDVYLRISTGELWQKKLLVAGLPRVFEIGRIFRNEGMSNEHLQDYTQLEFYAAYLDYRQGMDMAKDLYRRVAQTTFGTTRFSIRGFDVDLSGEWETYDFCALIDEHYGLDPLTCTLADITNKLDQEGIPHDGALNIERGVDLLWKKVRKGLGGPGFLVNVPVYLEPLAKRSRDDSRTVERFQIVIAGSEVGKGFSELNDPTDQRERFEHQQALRDAGDEEAQMADMEFVEALEYGMPPAFGFGVSERLFSFLMDKSVREGQIFPLLRPKGE